MFQYRTLALLGLLLAAQPTVAAPLPVDVTASSVQGGNETWQTVDSNPATRWCAADGALPQWLQLELPAAHVLTGCTITWESTQVYSYTVEGSRDGKAWSPLAKASRSGTATPDSFPASTCKLVRITCTATRGGQWASIREVTLQGPGLTTLIPGKTHATEAAADAYRDGGNITPSITRLSAAAEAQILKDVRVPEGFDLTLFANSAAANYPVFVAAAPNGDVYVSSDGNGSLGRKPRRGRIVRLRDTDGDGRADQVTEFVKDLDSPRGLLWDQDRLYVMHPPDLSVFIDRDGDGVAEERQVLIKGLAFGFKDRPADHTSNGISLGIDGWLYVAGGDFGFLDAVGTDGQHLQHRGGGVLRFRPDGTHLEIYSRGTRNILEVSIGPRLEMFARDNTNDGGGWDIRFHHFSGLEHHGYPTLYMHFGEEIVQPLADYGGGSGCGAVYLDEPGFGAWNDAPLTCDWGTGALWHHAVKPHGATFVETRKPEPFIRMTRPTDADVDAAGHVYQASWKGATFDWNGPDVGYLVRVSPKGFTAPPVPDFVRTPDGQLLRLLASPSHRTRLAAQRALLRRPETATMTSGLLALAGDRGKPVAPRVAALYALSQRRFGQPADPAVAALASDPALQPYVVRALADAKPAPPALFASALGSADARTRNEAIQGVVRQSLKELAPRVAILLGDADPVVAHTAHRGLAQMEAYDVCFAVLDSTKATPAHRAGALRALQLMPLPAVTDGLIARLGKETDAERRKGLISALCRLHHVEGEWKGNSWGTRPNTGSPLYQPAPWAQTPKVAAALKDLLARASAEEAGFLVAAMSRNQIKADDALQRLIALADKDPAMAARAIDQMAPLENIPPAGIPLLIRAAQDPATKPAVRAQAVVALGKVDQAEAAQAALSALVLLDRADGATKERDAARAGFTGAARLEGQLPVFLAAAEQVGTPTARWADAALLALSERKTGSPESREASRQALAKGWELPARRIQILQAVRLINHHAYAERVLAALDDPRPEVAQAARETATALKLEKKGADAGPLVGSLKPEDVIAQVLRTKGDVALGEQLFTRQACVTCHTVRPDQPPQGPYLGNIAQTYKRAELAQNILDPNKTIAQGFASEAITMNDSTAQMGFITFESADTIKLRTITAQEFTFAVKDIKSRQKLPISIMPPGLANNLTVQEFASLLDYLESLAK
jgi:putative membrane-bound dehydrogenase-like protein